MDGMLQPVVDEYSQPFWDGTAAGELRVQACGDCGRLRFPPRPMCPWCQSLAADWQVMSGRGTVFSFVVPHPPLLPAYAEVAPFNVVLVELEEDRSIRMVGNLVTDERAPINSIDPTTIEIGEPVHVVFARISDDVVLPQWVRKP
jgi:uncharacterized protein